MKITKYGHCCLLIEEGGLRILTDPGTFSAGFEAARNVDVILITHEHSDHFHLDSLKAVLANNAQAKVVTNSAVGALLEKEGLAFEVVEDGRSGNYKGVAIEGVGTEHAVIYPTLPNVMNTGYFIGGKLFYPGDALTNPERAVDILALPVTGPWMKISDALDYAIALKPRIWLPVHDGNLKSTGFLSYVSSEVLKPAGLEGVMPENGKEIDF